MVSVGTSGWYLVRVVFRQCGAHQGGILSGWYLVRVVSRQCGLIRVRSCQGGVSSVWAHQDGILSGWCLGRVVFCRGGLS